MSNCARRSKSRTGIKATTSVLALKKLLEIWRVKRLGLVTPYVDDVQAAIVKNYKAIGVEIGEGMERHLSVQKNNDIAAIGEDLLDGLVKEVVIANVDAVATFCTNLNAAQRVEVWEKKHVIPVFDTIMTVLWDMSRQSSVDMSELEGWGLIFKKS